MAKPNPAASTKLIRAVQACRRKVMGLEDDAAWRAFLVQTTKLDSLRAMAPRQLGLVIDALHRAGAPKAPGARPAHRLDDRPQARMARGLWIELADAGIVQDRRDAALDRFVERVTHRSSIRFCREGELNKVLEALKAMRDRGPPIPLPEPEIRTGETRDQAMVRTLWDALRHGGAMPQAGIFADLETWLLRQGFGERHVWLLDEDQARKAIEKLAPWYRRHVKETTNAED
jgi:hypothetical protein